MTNQIVYILIVGGMFAFAYTSFYSQGNPKQEEAVEAVAQNRNSVMAIVYMGMLGTCIYIGLRAMGLV